MTLTEFLLARIAEDETAVRGLTSGEDPDFFWGPDRIRAECEAKRRLLNHVASNWRLEESVAKILALPYADHKQFQEEWRA